MLSVTGPEAWGFGFRAMIPSFHPGSMMIPAYVDGRFAGTEEFDVASDRLHEQSGLQFTAFADGRFLAVWQHSGYTSAAKGQFFNSDGRKVGSEFLINSVPGGGSPAVATLATGGFVAIWHEARPAPEVVEVKGQRLDSTGQRIGEEFLVNTTTIGFQNHAEVTALAGGGFAVAWAHSENTGYDQVRMQAFDANANKVGGETIVHDSTPGDNLSPAITGLSGGGFVVAWQAHGADVQADWYYGGSGVRARIFDAEGNKIGSEFSLHTTIFGTQDSAALTPLANGGFVAVWRDIGSSPRAIRAQFFDSSGAKVGTELLVSTTAGSLPDIATLPGGEILIAWPGMRASEPFDIRAQLLNANGTKVGEEFVMNIVTRDSQNIPALLALPSGAFVAGWMDQGRSGDSGDVKARLFFPFVNGTAQADIIVGGEGRDFVRGHEGDDLLSGGAEADGLEGGSGVDSLEGGAGNDQLFGGTGDDVLDGGPGDDTIDGGEGADTASYASATAGVRADLRVAAAQNTGGAGTDILSGAENLAGSAFDDILMGSDGNNLLSGKAGNDGLHGRAGNDHLVGGAGADGLYGGDGDDWLEGGADRDYFEGDLGIDALYGDAGDDVIFGNEGGDGIHGGDGDDYLDGGDGSDYFEGGSGRDGLHGGLGDDVMFGGGDDDGLLGGGGDDYLNGGDGIDYFDGGIGNDGLYAGLGNDIIFGGAGDDGVHGEDGDDYLNGGEGADYMTGGTGNDSLDGDAGTNILTGGDGGDAFLFMAAPGTGFAHILDFAAGADRIVLDDAAFGLPPGGLSPDAFATAAAAQDEHDRIIYNPETGALLFDPDGSGSAAAVQFASLQPGLILAATDFSVI